ncbi:MAG: hypothetical protein AAGC53_15505 [Actinomycetota bacterium]
MTLPRPVLIAITALAVLASACGGDGSTTETSTPAADADETTTTTTEAASDPRVTEIKAVLQADDSLVITDTEATCAADRLVDELPSETIDELLANPDLEIDAAERPEEAETVLNVLLDCVDLERAMIDSMVADGTPLEDAQCMANEFGEDELRRLFAISQADDDDEAALGEAFEIVFGAMAACDVDLGG